MAETMLNSQAGSRAVAFKTPEHFSIPNGGLHHSTPLLSRRYTPFRKTPGSRIIRSTGRRQSAARCASAKRPAPKDQPLLKGLVNKTWQAYRVSPLFKLSHQAQALKSYQRSLCAYLEAEQNKGVAVLADAEKADQAVIRVYEGLESEEEPEALEFILKQKKKGDGAERMMLTALLCSCHVSEDIRRTIDKNFTLMPLLLVKGPVTLARHLKSWIQVQFDCRISLLTFSSVELSWMVAMWSGMVKDEKRNKPVELVYKVPDEVEGLSHITMDIDAKDCQKIWNCIHDKDSEEFYSAEVEKFIRSLETHFYSHFKIMLSAMPLNRIGTAAAYVGADGRLKIFMEENVLEILSHITELTFDRTVTKR